MYCTFWRHGLFLGGQSFSVKIFHRSCSSYQVIRLGAGDNFCGPSVQAVPLPSSVSFSCAHFFFDISCHISVPWQVPTEVIILQSSCIANRVIMNFRSLGRGVLSRLLNPNPVEDKIAHFDTLCKTGDF